MIWPETQSRSLKTGNEREVLYSLFGTTLTAGLAIWTSMCKELRRMSLYIFSKLDMENTHRHTEIWGLAIPISGSWKLAELAPDARPKLKVDFGKVIVITVEGRRYQWTRLNARHEWTFRTDQGKTIRSHTCWVSWTGPGKPPKT